jgi:Zn-dependent protease
MIRYIKSDLRNLSFTECWYMTRSPAVLFVLGAKLLRLPWYMGAGIPWPDDIRQCEVSESALEPWVRDAIRPGLEAFLGLGFHTPRYLCPRDNLSPNEACLATMLHPSGAVLARVTAARVLGVHPPKIEISQGVQTRRADGSWISTVSRRRSYDPIPGDTSQYLVGAPVPELWAAHAEFVRRHSRGQEPQWIRTVEEFWAAQNALERASMEHHVSRGHFVRMTEEEVEELKTLRRASGIGSAAPPQMPPPPAPPPVVPVGADMYGVVPPPLPPEAVAPPSLPPMPRPDAAMAGVDLDAPVLFELAKLERKKSNTGSAWILFVVTLALFVPSFLRDRDWLFLGLLVPVLLFHELGHFFAMKLFGYRNLQMFFIPFLGAAVTGTQLQAPAWKKVIVSLAGPVPGLVIGLALRSHMNPGDPDWVRKLANVLITLNAFNLLPLLPLDGGQVLNAVLFGRNRWMEATFQVLAAAGLIAFSLSPLGGTVALALVGGLMLMGVRHTLRVGRVVSELRREGMVLDAPGATSISAGIARAILGRLRPLLPKSPRPASQLALDVRTIYERLHTAAPGWFLSCVLLGAHAMALLAPLVALVWPWVRMGWEMERSMEAYERRTRPVIPWECSAIPSIPAGEVEALSTNRVTVIVSATNDFAAANLMAWSGSFGSEIRRVSFGRSLALTHADPAPGWASNLMAGATARGLESAVEWPRSNLMASFQISFALANPTVRSNLTAEVADFLGLPPGANAIPPWEQLPGDRPPEWSRWAMARATWRRIEAMPRSATNAQAVRLREEISAASKAKNRELVRELGEKLGAVNQQWIDDALQAALTNAPSDVERAVVLARLRRPQMIGVWTKEKLAASGQQDAEWLAEVGPLFGTRHRPDEGRSFVYSKTGDEQADQMKFTGGSDRVEHLLPKLVRYLCAYGATNLLYRVSSDDDIYD